MKKSELQQLAARAAKGESAAWDSLYREISRISASVCSKNSLSREDAEDVSQETALAIAGRLSELAAMDNPEGYLRRVAGSKSVDIIRSESKTPVESLHEDEDHILNLPDANSAPENEVAGLSADRMIDDFIAELPEDQRVALIMRYYDGYTNAQIAKELGVPIGTVASRILYGKKALKKRVEKYEMKNNIRLHAKIAFPFLPWRMFRNQALRTAEIIATDGGSSVSGSTRAVTSLLTSVVLCGALIGMGFVLQGNNNPSTEVPAPTRTVTEQAEPTAATVYEDIYETQVETVYNPVNVVQNEDKQQRARQTAENQSGLPDSFQFAGNRFEPSEKLLTSNSYHAANFGATLTFPVSWVNKVNVEDNDKSIHIKDRGTQDNPVSEYTGLLSFYSQDITEDELSTFFPSSPHGPFKHSGDLYEEYSLTLGLSELSNNGKYKYRVYRCSLNWNRAVMNKTDLDYSNINRDVLSVIESFRPDTLKYTNLLTQEEKDAVMKITDFRIQTQ